MPRMIYEHEWYIREIKDIISYLGMKSWDLHVCDRASTITHVDCVKKSNPWYNKIWFCLNVTIWSSQMCLSIIFIHFVIISKHRRKKLHLFTLFSITRHCVSLFLVGSKSMLALLPFKVAITPRRWNDKCFHRAGGDLICRFCICASHFQCIVGAQQEILCLTARTTWLIWRVWPRSLRMSVPAWRPGPWFNIKMLSYQYMKSHCGDKTILRPSYLHNGISYTGKTTSLYWTKSQDVVWYIVVKLACPIRDSI